MLVCIMYICVLITQYTLLRYTNIVGRSDEEDLEENRAAKRRRYEEDLEGNRAA